MDDSSWLCSIVSWKFKFFVANILSWSQSDTSNSFNNGHSKVCTPWYNHLSFGNLRSIKWVTLGNRTVPTAPSSLTTISLIPQSVTESVSRLWNLVNILDWKMCIRLSQNSTFKTWSLEKEYPANWSGHMIFKFSMWESFNLSKLGNATCKSIAFVNDIPNCNNSNIYKVKQGNN